MFQNRRKTACVAMGLFLTLILSVFLHVHQVSLRVTAEDKAVFDPIFKDISNTDLMEKSTFEDEIRLIQKVQKKALELSPNWEGIPLGETREPKDLVRWSQGICYDRSRFIEKALRYFGFKVRHVAIYEKQKEGVIASLFRPGINSHSASEVKTSRGWLYVDSNFEWISLSHQGVPIGLREIQRVGTRSHFVEQHRIPDILRSDFITIYGLYSRHGLFYPPFNAFPDLSLQELFHNLVYLN